LPDLLALLAEDNCERLMEREGIPRRLKTDGTGNGTGAIANQYKPQRCIWAITRFGLRYTNLEIAVEYRCSI